VDQAGKASSGGERAGAMGMGSGSSPRCRRMARTGTGSWMTAMTRRRPLQWGQCKASTAKTRRSSSAQGMCCGAGGVEEDGFEAFWREVDPEREGAGGMGRTETEHFSPAHRGTHSGPRASTISKAARFPVSRTVDVGGRSLRDRWKVFGLGTRGRGDEDGGVQGEAVLVDTEAFLVGRGKPIAARSSSVLSALDALERFARCHNRNARDLL
jgi:hypothetical protein